MRLDRLDKFGCWHCYGSHNIPNFTRLSYAIGMDTQRKSLLDGCDNWEFSANLPEWNKHPKVIQDTGMRPDIVFHSSATPQIIMVELTIP
ncbi:reverse transcriptase [Plakobranchus ocellatus]|uniref:Reverse transcriptase n=1 Tax=Plakobranchus ocellatus TaxID=259542 RepID=A0AAV3XVK8_9GAST|nr:reverse transcriptase [Plakobranchus ocellatus]